MTPTDRRYAVAKEGAEALTPERLKDLADGPIMDPSRIYLPAGKVSLEEVQRREAL